MNLHYRPKILELELKLNERYEKLLSELRGTELTDEEMDTFSHNENSVKINALELRLAVEDFSAILKEIKKIGK